MTQTSKLETGLTGQSRLAVTEADTAKAVGSGDLDVLATPRMIALMEAAAVACVSGSLANGETSVGTRIDVSHVSATRVGSEVTARARLAEIDGRQLTFDVEAHDGAGLVGKGRHVRAVVDRDRFLQKLREKSV